VFFHEFPYDILGQSQEFCGEASFYLLRATHGVCARGPSRAAAAAAAACMSRA
jgi:hypothetical protein